MKQMEFDQAKWLELLQLSSIPLRKLDPVGYPIGIASGCLIDYLDRKILLSVFHATKSDGNWAIELKYEKGKGTAVYPLGAFNYLAEIKLGTSVINDVDFSYTEIAKDVESFFQQLTPQGDIISERKRPAFTPSFASIPTKDEIYGFSGQVLPEMHRAIDTFITEHRTYPGLKYEATEGAYHIFTLPVEHPGHEHFKGCSGAPIIDTKGNIVSLVCHGDMDRNAIFGVALNHYKVALDITYGQLLKA